MSSSTEHQTKTLIEIKPPELYTLKMHNDDSTAMEFVINVLCYVVEMNVEEAYAKTIEAHNNGKAVLGSYVKNKATALRDEMMELAHTNGFNDFTVTVEKEG